MSKQPESVSDFKARIAQLMRERETGKQFSVIGAARSHECVVRGKGDAPTPSEVLRNKREAAQQ
jgi:hypothetical protein